jgi:hypothetical protein
MESAAHFTLKKKLVSPYKWSLLEQVKNDWVSLAILTKLHQFSVKIHVLCQTDPSICLSVLTKIVSTDLMTFFNLIVI